MEFENGEIPEAPGEAESAGGASSSRALVIGAFAAGVLVGGALTIGLLVFGRTAIGRMDIAKPRPRRLLIGNLEIEERGDDARFHVQ
jgi:hypothetical protein